MSEPETPVTPDPEPTPDPKADPQVKVENNTFRADVPLENQVGEWKRKAEKAEQEAAELRAYREEQEASKLSEIEKAQKAATEATERATAAEQRALTLERSQWVTAAARTAGFADPADAALAVNLSEVEDEQAAKAAVEQLANDKPHWLSQAKPQGFGTIGDRAGREEQPPLGADGKPDMKAGLGKELAKSLLGGR